MIHQFAPVILKIILPKVSDHLCKVFKLDKVLQYVEQPNELDKQVEDMKIKIEALEKIVIDLGKDSHPMQPFDDRITALEKKVG
tara:strand:+ start:964 stop:1215 length:252 start_codon:yes stop_codon:yes gene_type:complete